LIERYVTTIPRAERTRALAQIVRHLSEQIPTMGLFDTVDSTIFSARLDGVTPRTEFATQVWNAHQWRTR
jgi:hypothetical protein